MNATGEKDARNKTERRKQHKSSKVNRKQRTRERERGGNDDKFRKDSTKFPNFEDLTKEEKLVFFQALTTARKNVEKKGVKPRETFGTVHDEYLKYLEDVEEGKMEPEENRKENETDSMKIMNLYLKKAGNFERKNFSTPEFDALDAEEKKVFFKTLREAHDSYMKKKSGGKKNESWQLNVVAKSDVAGEEDGARRVEETWEEGDLKVKVLLTSGDNERLTDLPKKIKVDLPKEEEEKDNDVNDCPEESKTSFETLTKKSSESLVSLKTKNSISVFKKDNPIQTPTENETGQKSPAVSETVSSESINSRKGNPKMAEEKTETAEEKTEAAEEKTETAEEKTKTAEEKTKTTEEKTKTAEEKTKKAEEKTKTVEEKIEKEEVEIKKEEHKTKKPDTKKKKRKREKMYYFEIPSAKCEEIVVSWSKMTTTTVERDSEIELAETTTKESTSAVKSLTFEVSHDELGEKDKNDKKKQSGRLLLVDEDAIEEIKTRIQDLEKAKKDVALEKEYLNLVVDYVDHLSNAFENLAHRNQVQAFHAGDLHLKFKDSQLFDKKKHEVKPELKKFFVPRSVSDQNLQGNFPENLLRAKHTPTSSPRTLSRTPKSESETAISSESEGEHCIFSLTSGKKNLLTTNIRLLQDLLNDKAEFVEGSAEDFKIRHLPVEEVEPEYEPPKVQILKDEEEGPRRQDIRYGFFKACGKLCGCWKKQKVDEDGIFENLKGETVRIDVREDSKKDIASAALNDSTIEVLKSAHRKNILRKYYKEE